MRLSQALATVETTKATATTLRTEEYKRIQKEDLFSGHSRSWVKVNDDSPDMPHEHKRVQEQVVDVFARIVSVSAPWYDACRVRDAANCEAKASVIVDGATILKDVEVTFLLFIEKDLVHWRTLIAAAPVLDPSYEWSISSDSGLARTPSVKTAKTAKVQRAIVLYDATEHHPAQTQLVSEDIVVGNWETTRLSGGITSVRQRELISRVDRLILAVKKAREEANASAAPDVRAGAAIFDFIFG